MERIDTLNPERIAWCLDDFGISATELAKSTGISQTTVDGLLAGERGLTFKQLQKVADFFGRGVLFFAQQGAVEESSMRSPQFRTLTNQRPDLAGGAETHRAGGVVPRGVPRAARRRGRGGGAPVLASSGILAEVGDACQACSPLGVSGEPYVRAVLDALSARRITLNKACGFLGDPQLTELHRLEDEFAGSSAPVVHSPRECVTGAAGALCVKMP